VCDPTAPAIQNHEPRVVSLFRGMLGDQMGR
jgi:hypothetical protein